MRNRKLYPIHYKGKYYLEEECDDLFTAFYHTRDALNGANGVYVSEGTWVYPDGSMGEW